MEISKLNQAQQPIKPVPPVAPSKEGQPKAQESTKPDPVKDIVDLTSTNGTNGAKKTESQPKQAGYYADISKMREIWAEHDRQIASFQKMMQSLIQKQADKAQQAGGQWDYKDPNAMVEIDSETRAKAQEAISDGGYFSVEKTASRLLDFAVAISGGDPAKISLLRDAVQKGFDAAEKQWGDKLPDISKKTYDAVMNGFDEWQKNGSSKDIGLLQSSAV